MNAGFAEALALLMAVKHAKRRPSLAPTPEQTAAAARRDERRRWNDEVAARKAAKKNRQEPA